MSDKDAPEQYYTQFPNKTLEGIAGACLSGCAAAILLVLGRMSFGHHREHAPVSLGYLANATGRHRSQVARELKNLLKRGLIRQSKPASFRQSAEYVITDTVRKFAYSAQTHSKGVRKDAHPEYARARTPEYANSRTKKEIEKKSKEKIEKNPPICPPQAGDALAFSEIPLGAEDLFQTWNSVFIDNRRIRLFKPRDVNRLIEHLNGCRSPRREWLKILGKIAEAHPYWRKDFSLGFFNRSGKVEKLIQGSYEGDSEDGDSYIRRHGGRELFKQTQRVELERIEELKSKWFSDSPKGNMESNRDAVSSPPPSPQAPKAPDDSVRYAKIAQELTKFRSGITAGSGNGGGRELNPIDRDLLAFEIDDTDNVDGQIAQMLESADPPADSDKPAKLVIRKRHFYPNTKTSR